MVECGQSYTIKFWFDKEYGTITEGDYTLAVYQDSTKTHYTAANVTFTVVQPVSGTSNGSITATLTAPTTSQLVNIELYKLATNMTQIDRMRVRAVVIGTALESTKIQK